MEREVVYEVRFVDRCFAPYTEVRVYKVFKTRKAAELHLDVPGQGRGYIVKVHRIGNTVYQSVLAD